MPASLGVAVGQFVDQDELWFPLQRPVQIKLLQLHPAVVDLLTGQDLQPIQERQCVRPGVGLYIAHHHIHALSLRLMCRLQHGIGLAHTRCIAKKDFQFSGKACMFRTYFEG